MLHSPMRDRDVVAINIQELPPNVQLKVEQFRALHSTKAVYVHLWGKKHILKTFPESVRGSKAAMRSYEAYLMDMNYKLVLGSLDRPIPSALAD